MSYFSFDGKNTIFQNLIAQLPQGAVYLKEGNVIPVAQVVTFWEEFNTAIYPIGTPVEIYINDSPEPIATVPVNASGAIYYKMTPKAGQSNATPYGKFHMRCFVNGTLYSDFDFYSMNFMSFLVALAKNYNYDYTEIFKMFGNIYYSYLQDDMLYNSIGWYYDFVQPTGWSTEDYRNILIGAMDTNYNSFGGNNFPINWLFMNSMTYFSMNELIKSFTGVYPSLFSYRDEMGWIICNDNGREDELYNNLPFFRNYYIEDEYSFTGVNDLTGLNLNGYNLTLQIFLTDYTINFTTTTGGVDIVNQINAGIVFPGFVASLVDEDYNAWTAGHPQYIRLLCNNVAIENTMVIKSGTAVSVLGLNILQFQKDDLTKVDYAQTPPLINDTDSDVIVLYDEAYLWNKIDLAIHKGTKTVTETVTRYSGLYDQLIHQYPIDTPLHPLSVAGYTKAVDYTFTTNANSNGFINWIDPAHTLVSSNMTSQNLSGLTLELSINDQKVLITFSTTATTVANIVAQINNKFIGITPASGTTTITFTGWGIKFISGTALSLFGFTVGQKTGSPQKGEQYVVIYSYFMRNELIPLCELNKPAFLKINYYFLEE